MLTSPSAKDAKVSHTPEEEQELPQSKLSKQASKNDRVNQEASHEILFSKNNKRKAHTPTCDEKKPGEANNGLVLVVTLIITWQSS